MSSPILPIDIEGPFGPPRVTPSVGSAEDIGAFVSELTAGETTLSLAASRGGPPPEVLDQIAAAGRVDERLREDGHQLRFTPAEPGGRTRIELCDREGNAVRTLSTAEALEMAAGKPLA
jgi:hypothetical protein